MSQQHGLNMRGTLVWWKFKTSEFDSFKLEQKLESLGVRKVQPAGRKTKRLLTYSDFLPRNDYKACLLRAVRSVVENAGVMLVENGKKKEKKFYKRIQDVKESCSICVFMPIEVRGGKATATADIIVKLDKKSGALTFESDTTENQKLLDAYRHAQKTYGSDQISPVLTKIIQEEAYGIGLKGGVFYVPISGDDVLENIKKITDYLGDAAKLYQTPVYNDKTTTEAIQDAVEDDLLSRIKEVKSKFDKEVSSGKMTLRQKQGRLTELKDLISRATQHKNDLASKAEMYNLGISELSKDLDKKVSFVDNAIQKPGDYEELWNKILQPKK